MPTLAEPGGISKTRVKGPLSVLACAQACIFILAVVILAVVLSRLLAKRRLLLDG